MADFKGEINGEKINGQISIWPGVAGGALVALAAVLTFGVLGGDDSDSNTYKPYELHTVDFHPSAGIDCTGLSPKDSDEVIASTITCKSVEG